ncbi:MAG: hypothetical protein K9W42_05560 [Candidatus Heimdallarchaeota archaeon]|nr:hypothetical protein [Candidatus Heimdallarchaeota archaeon]
MGEKEQAKQPAEEPEPSSPETEEEEEENAMPTSEDERPFRTDFSLPIKIKRIKILIAIVINLILGGVTTSMGIYFFVKPQVNNTTYNVIFAIFMLLFGGIIFLKFPFVMARTINSQLILSGEEIKLRNAFSWKKVPWREVEEILAREKLSKDIAEGELLGVDLIRFRTVTTSIHFLAENYPAADADEMLLAIARTFERVLEGTDFEVEERTERPSLQTRLRYFVKVAKK